MIEKGLRQSLAEAEGPVDFMARFTSSEQFGKVFQEGMSLVEETANYLDGPGRRDARLLDRHGAIAYATESMRLTTRLMQLASWLLMQRAVSAGELTKEAARSEKHRINLAEIGPGYDLRGSDQVPDGLKELISRSLKLHERVVTLDRRIVEAEAAPAQARNPIAGHMSRLTEVFEQRKSEAS
jgi:regulator of CtrA degradation